MDSLKWKTSWDQRYQAEDFVFGTDPNQFLVDSIDLLPKGAILCAGDGEGRNGVWLAQQGFMVTSVDYSAVGLEKARRLADRSGVNIEFIKANLLEMDLPSNHYSAVVHIFVHMHESFLPQLHEKYRALLQPGGIFLAEVFSKRQLAYGSGGPKSLNALYECDHYRRDFAGYEELMLKEEIKIQSEGQAHQGEASVIRAIFRQPKN